MTNGERPEKRSQEVSGGRFGGRDLVLRLVAGGLCVSFCCGPCRQRASGRDIGGKAARRVHTARPQLKRPGKCRQRRTNAYKKASARTSLDASAHHD